MTAFIEEPTVTVAEVAKLVGRPVDEVKAEATALAVFIGHDWGHREAISCREAYVLVDGSARRNQDHENLFRGYMASLDQWQQDRENVRRQAWQEAHDSEVRLGVGAPQAAQQGHEAARTAVADFERRNPEPVFAEPASDSRVQGWLKRVKAGTR